MNRDRDIMKTINESKLRPSGYAYFGKLGTPQGAKLYKRNIILFQFGMGNDPTFVLRGKFLPTST